jgi:hypothetical protein
VEIIAMKRVVFPVALAVAALFASIADSLFAADAPADRVAVMYFHRTQRCPTCLRMGGYSEEAITTGFAQQLKSGKVGFYYIDFQDPKNEAISNGYAVAGPTLIVAKIAGDKVLAYKNLKEMWAKSCDKQAFVDYVQTNVKEYLK